MIASAFLVESRRNSVRRMPMSKNLAMTGLLVFLIAGLLISCSGRSPADLETKDLVIGTGDQAVKGATLTMHYTGWLYANGHHGKKFDSSLGGPPFTFKLGAGEVIDGWDRGIEGMKVGGKRELIIPPQLGYGAKGAPPDIPPNAVLSFEVQLLAVQK
jgi:FKBP-type peptidyl-prolyl cis-trans isomerase